MCVTITGQCSKYISDCFSLEFKQNITRTALKLNVLLEKVLMLTSSLVVE